MTQRTLRPGGSRWEVVAAWTAFSRSVSDQTITGSSRFIIDNSSTVTPQASVEFMGLGSGTLGGEPVIVDISGENRTPWYLTMRDKTSSSGSFLGFFSNGSSDVWGIGIIDSAGSPVSDVLFGADGEIQFEQSLAKNIDFIGQSGTVSFTANGNIIFAADNTQDIGASGATRPRTGYFGTSVVTPALQLTGTSASLPVCTDGSKNLTTSGCSVGTGTVTSVAETFTGGLISVAGSPVTTNGTLALTVAGTSGGVPYFSSSSAWASSAALTNHAVVVGGGAGAAPSTLSSLGTYGQVLHRTTEGASPSFQAAPVSATAFGATGSGTMSGAVVSGTDDTTALQNWANYCATNGLRCYLPSPAVNHCYRITHLILGKSGPSGANAGWPSQETTFEMFGDGMDSQFNLQQRQFQKSTFCATDTTEPAIQVNDLSVSPAGSYYARGYNLHDFAVIQSTTTPIVAMNGVNDSSIMNRVRVQQVGTGSGIVWDNLWLDSGPRSCNVFSEQGSPHTGSLGIWLYNDDAAAPGGGQISVDGNGVQGFDIGIKIGTIPAATSAFFAAGDGISTPQQIDAVSLHGVDSENNNYNYVFGDGVLGLDMGPWYSATSVKGNIIISSAAADVTIHNGFSYEPNDTLGEIGIDGGSGSRQLLVSTSSSRTTALPAHQNTFYLGLDRQAHRPI